MLGRDVDAVYRDIHTDHGVRMLMGTGVEAFEGDGSVERVRTNDGRSSTATSSSSGSACSRARTRRTGGLDVDDGILVDERLQTSMPGVFAAGDVAAPGIRSTGSGSASSTGPTRSTRGRSPRATCSARGQIYDCLPYFFSDQYDVGMEYSGFARTWDRVVFRGDPASREFIAFWLAGDRVLAGMNVNVWDVVDPIQRLIRERVPVDDRRLADPDVPLEQLAPRGVDDEPPPAAA